MARGASVKKTEFEFVKELLKKGEKAIDISKKLKRSPETIRTIDYAEDYDDFCSTPSKELRKRRKMRKAEQMQINVDEVHDETKPEAVDNPTEEECIHHFKVARKATAICAIMLSCEHFSIEDGVVNLRMPFHVFSNLADQYKGSDE